MSNNYEISVAASHAARTIFRNFTVREKGTIEATEHNLGIIIDVCTQIFRAQGAMNQLIKDIPWADREALIARMDRLRAAVESLKAVRSKMPKYDGIPIQGEDGTLVKRYQVSAPAAHAARTLSNNFVFVRKANLDCTERNLAILVDVCTEVFRVELAVDMLVRKVSAMGTNYFSHSMQELQDALRAVEIVRNRLPCVASAATIPVAMREQVEIKLTRTQLKETQAFAQRVAAAPTIAAQQALLQRAGLVVHG